MTIPVTIEDWEHGRQIVLAAWRALDSVVMLPGSPDKRFRRDMSGQTDLTPRQFDYLRRLIHRYRRQIGESAHRQHTTALASVAVSYDGP